MPHRNELSETVGSKIVGKNKIVIYIPDIDDWGEWDKNIIDVIRNNDILILDGTFFSKKEIKHRNIDKIPHPSIQESMSFFSCLDKEDRKKIFFTHLNHTNLALNENSSEYNDVITSGYNILKDRQIFKL